MRKPIIGVTFESEDKLQPLLDALTVVGASSIPISPRHFSPFRVAMIDGLLLGGGHDISPSLYFEPTHPLCGQIDPDRDALEMRLIALAEEWDIPVLGVCRGMQMINVYYGGTLDQHLADAERHHHRFGVLPFSAVHGVALVDLHSPLLPIAAPRFAIVNSRHHQGIARLGGGLKITGRSEDDCVEAIWHPSRRYMCGVQWHPEDRVDSSVIDREIFERFISASRARR